MDIRAIEKKLARRLYEDVDNELQAFDDRALIELLDSRSVKVGSSAADLLSRRGKADTVIDDFFWERSRQRPESSEFSSLCGYLREVALEQETFAWRC